LSVKNSTAKWIKLKKLKENSVNSVN